MSEVHIYPSDPSSPTDTIEIIPGQLTLTIQSRSMAQMMHLGRDAAWGRLREQAVALLEKNLRPALEEGYETLKKRGRFNKENHT